MKFITPKTITSAMLVSSTRAENDHAAWSNATTYALGNKCISTTTHRIYESVQGSNTNHDPTTDDGTWWLDIGPTNRWAMFDQGIGTVTSVATPLTVVIDTGLVDSLALLDVAGNSVQVSMTDGAGGPTIYNETYPLGDTQIVLDWFDYFFTEIVPQTTLIVTDLPLYGAARLTVSIVADTTAECGTLVIGNMADLGKTLASPRVSIVDYSRKDADQFGVTSIVERAYAKKIEARFWMPMTQVDYVTRRLSGVRATPCVWIADDDEAIESLIAYGFYRDWGIDLTYTNYCEATINLESLT